MDTTKILSQAQTIYSETEAGKNTANRVGQEFIDIINETSDSQDELLLRIMGTSSASSALTDPQVSLGTDFDGWDAVSQELETLASGRSSDSGHFVIGSNGVRVDVWNFAANLSQRNYVQVMLGGVETGDTVLMKQATEAHILYRYCEGGIWGSWRDYLQALQDTADAASAAAATALTTADAAASDASAALTTAQTASSTANAASSSAATALTTAQAAQSAAATAQATADSAQATADQALELAGSTDEGIAQAVYPFDMTVAAEASLETLEAEVGAIVWVEDSKQFYQKTAANSWTNVYGEVRSLALFRCDGHLYQFNGSALRRLLEEGDVTSGGGIYYEIL